MLNVTLSASVNGDYFMSIIYAGKLKPSKQNKVSIKVKIKLLLSLKEEPVVFPCKQYQNLVHLVVLNEKNKERGQERASDF